MNRRAFGRAIALGGAALPALFAQPPKKLKFGHTGLTWGRVEPEVPITDIAQLGFYGYETFGNIIEQQEASGGIGKILEKHNLPLISGYCTCNLTDPTVRKDEIQKMVNWGKLIKKNGGRVSVVGPNGVKRDEYDFKAHKANIVETLNEVGRALTDIGILPVLHQHTGTSVESHDETYAVLEAMDTRYMKFGPDIGQLQKGGSDPVKVVKDFLPLVHHMHLKDYNGGEHFLGYCPLGQGEVNIPAILELMETVEPQGMIMVELDRGRNPPMTAKETATIAKTYLEKLGYTFRTS